VEKKKVSSVEEQVLAPAAEGHACVLKHTSARKHGLCPWMNASRR
jgi:hypothetical protein